MNRSSFLRHKISSIVLTVAALPLSSCTFNIFAPIDSPSGDAQLLSAAYAAMDRGDFATAVQDFQKVSSLEADNAASGEAFALLAENNIGMGAFATAFGSGSNVNAGIAITSLANSIGSLAGQQARLQIFQAFQLGIGITDNTPLRGMVRFLSAVALIAETLAEGAANPNHVVATDSATGGSACSASTCTGSSCNRPSASNLTSGPYPAIDLSSASTTSATLSNSTNAPTLSLIQSALQEVNTGLTEIGAGTDHSLRPSKPSFPRSMPLIQPWFSRATPLAIAPN